MNRVRQRALALLPVPALVVVTLALPAVSGCSGANCKANDTPRVAANRVVTLFTLDYVYVRQDAQDRIDYTLHAKDAIHDAYNTVNRIFREEGINLQVVPLRITDMDVPQLTTSVFGDPANINEMVQVHQGREKIIGVHWSEQEPLPGIPARHEASKSCQEPRCNWVHMYSYFRTNNPYIVGEKTGRALANAFGLYFNLDYVETKTNLMADSSERGTKLSTGQRNIVRTTINTGRTLESITCNPPVEPAKQRPEID